MSQFVTVRKIGVGTGTGTEAIRPDTTALEWRVIEEHETEFVIEILN